MKFFAGVKTIEELRKQYRELLKKYHPDNEGGSVEITQKINAEYDLLFADMSKKKRAGKESYDHDEKAENDENNALKEIISKIAHINAEVEIIGSWVWVHGGYEYRELLKSIGFKFAPKKKCWYFYYGEYKRHHKGEISLEEIRQKYGCQKVNHKSKQYAIS